LTIFDEEVEGRIRKQFRDLIPGKLEIPPGL
jgi:hypothetical protein